MTTINREEITIDAGTTSPAAEEQPKSGRRSPVSEKFPGQMQILEFSNLKNQLGDRWDGEKATVHATVEKILASELGPWDFSTLIGQENYLIVFDEDDAGAAQKTSSHITDKIKAVLNEGARSTLLDVRPKDGKLYKKILSEALSEPATGGDLPKLDRHKRQSPAWREISKPDKKEGTETEKLDIALDQIRASDAKQRAQYEIGYSPIWNVRQEVLVGYGVTPYSKSSRGPLIVGHEVLRSGGTPTELLKLDARMLQTQIEVTAQLYQNNFTSLLLSHIHFDTLSSAIGRKEISAITQKIPDPLKQVLMVEIIGIPDHTPPATLAQRIAGLSSIFRSLTIRVPNLSFPASDCAAMGATSVAYEISARLNPASLLSDARKFIASAKAARLLTTFEGVPNIIIAEALKDAGAVFITGNVLGDMLDAPENMRPLTLKDVRAQAQALF